MYWNMTYLCLQNILSILSNPGEMDAICNSWIKDCNVVCNARVRNKGVVMMQNCWKEFIVLQIFLVRE